MKTLVTVAGSQVDMDAAVNLMDDELREAVHAELAPCEAQDFIDRYCTLHRERFADDFVVNLRSLPVKPQNRLSECAAAIGAVMSSYPDMAVFAAVHDHELNAADGGNTMHTFQVPAWSVAQYDTMLYREGVASVPTVTVTLDPAKRAQTHATLVMLRAIQESGRWVTNQCAAVLDSIDAEAAKRIKEVKP